MVKITEITHFSIPVANLDESERFYADVLGMEPKGRLGNSRMSAFSAGGQNIILCERTRAVDPTIDQESRVHHSFTVSPNDWEEAVTLVHTSGVRLDDPPIVYREKGFFTGRELYFFDPTGNVLELRDPTWKPGMPTPSVEEISGASKVSR
jgi:extradiol dioxygenase family protein